MPAFRAARLPLITSASIFILLGAVLARTEMARAYAVTDLGTLGGGSSEAHAINGSGHVAGWANTASGAVRGFIYRDGVMTDLGTLPGGSYSYATGINDREEVVGHGGINEHGPQFSEVMQGFLWRDGFLRPLGALYCPCTFNKRYGESAGYGINGMGQLVGWSETVRGSWVHHAFLWQDDAMQDIGSGAGDWSISRAFGINDAGYVAGDFAQDAGRLAAPFDRMACIWQDSVRQDIGTLPGHTSSTARGIGATGLVVGESGNTDRSAVSAFVWNGTVLQDLGALPGHASSTAAGVNSFGHVVGESGGPGPSSSRAFLWDSGSLYDLNDLVSHNSAWVLRSATAINDAGQIAGIGQFAGQTRAFLLTPVTSGTEGPGRKPPLVEQ